jgi:hypothetical protein
MRSAFGIVCLSSVLSLPAIAQQLPPLIKREPILQRSEERLVREIAIIGNDIPSSVRKKISHGIRGRTCNPEEIQERVRWGLRDVGYEEARVDEAQFAPIKGRLAFTACDVSIRVLPGPKYLLGSIQFQGNTAIPREQLRREFAVQTGGLFNATEIGRGLENIKNLYLSKGYINMGAIPKTETNEPRHSIMLTVDVDEGKAWDFGRLLLEGPEPYAGAGKALIAAWTLEGKRFNPKLLTTWITSNAPYLPKEDGVLWRTAQPRFNWVTQRVDIQLELPWPDPPSD